MSRLVTAIMAGLLCALAGIKHAASLKGDASRLNRWVQVLDHLALLFREGALSIPEALCAAADSPLPPDNVLRDMADKLSAVPLLTPAQAYTQCSGDCIEKNILLRMFTRLGHGTKENRILALEQSAGEIRLLADAASSRAEKDAKLWQTLGFVGGACLTILLL